MIGRKIKAFIAKKSCRYWMYAFDNILFSKGREERHKLCMKVPLKTWLDYWIN